MTVLIVEDEKLSADHLVSLLADIDREIQVLAVLDTIKATADFIMGDAAIDLLFMDIHLADGNSFDLFSMVNVDIPIIFTTAYDAYAIPAFKQNSVDYLLKPIAIPDLQFAIGKYKSQRRGMDNVAIENFRKAYTQLQTQYKSRFLIKTGQTIDIIQTSDVHHFITNDSLAFLVTSKGSRYLIDYTMDQLETMLEPRDFFRINRKVIVRINSVGKVLPYFNSRLSLSAGFLEGDALIVSRERVNDFKAWLDS